jgi:uncharacterized protein YegP (UPF0339 family)
MASSTKVDVSKIDAEKIAEKAMKAGDLGPEAEILGTRVESTGAVIVVTDAGVKARVTPDGDVEHLVGPQAAPDIYEPPEFTPTDTDDVAAGAEDLPPLEPTEPSSGLEPTEPTPQDSQDSQDSQDKPDHFEVFKGEDDQFYVRQVDAAGEIVFASEGYEKQKEAKEAAELAADGREVKVVRGKAED